MNDPQLGDVLVTAENLQRRVRELGAEISRDYAGRDLLLICVLKGAVLFLSDLMRAIEVPCQLDFMAVASYGSATDSSGVVRILKDLDAPIAGREVLIVEDIVDSGLTLQYLLRSLGARDPARSRTGSLSDTASIWTSATAIFHLWLHLPKTELMRHRVPTLSVTGPSREDAMVGLKALPSQPATPMQTVGGR
jgi:hypoxanthine phosphoribosyltransferase